MLKFQDRLHSHPYFHKAAVRAIRYYIKLYDSPPKSTTEEDDEMSKLPPQKKKMRQKLSKAEARAKKKFNPTELFEDTLIEREYVKCTSSAIQGLALFKQLHPNHRKKEIDQCMSKRVKYIKDTRNQNQDGS